MLGFLEGSLLGSWGSRVLITQPRSCRRRCSFTFLLAWEASRSRAAMGLLTWWRSRSQLATSLIEPSFTPFWSLHSSCPLFSFSQLLLPLKVPTSAHHSVLIPIFFSAHLILISVYFWGQCKQMRRTGSCLTGFTGCWYLANYWVMKWWYSC